MRACAACGNPVPIRWRIDGPPPCVVHRAGPVISCREYRRSCPDYIVDRRQTCVDCGRVLAAGRWAMFFLEGALVMELGVGNRAPILNYLRCGEDHPRCRK